MSAIDSSHNQLLKHVLELIGGVPRLLGIESMVSTITEKYLKEHLACEDVEKPTCCGEHTIIAGNVFDMWYVTRVWLQEHNKHMWAVGSC